MDIDEAKYIDKIIEVNKIDINMVDFSIAYFINRKCTVKWNIPECVYSFHNLLFIYEGECNYYINGELFRLKKGDIIYTPQGARGSATTPKENLMQCYAMNFKIKNYNDKGNDNNANDNNKLLPTFIQAGINNEILQLLQKMNHSWLVKEDEYVLKCRALFMLLFHKLVQITKLSCNDVPKDVRINKVIKYISEHLTEKIQMQKLSEISRLNPVYLGNLFKMYEGKTVIEYITEVRIGKACELLSAGDCTVKEASFESGFSDPYYFSKIFKKITGIAPSKYIKDLGVP